MDHIMVTGTNEMTKVHMLIWQYITQNGGESNAPRNKKAETLSLVFIKPNKECR